MFHLIQEEHSTEFAKLIAMQRIGFQGFPGAGVEFELSEVLREDAVKAVKHFGRISMPWLKWPTEEEEAKETQATMSADARGLIGAWIQYFDPDNAEAYTVPK